MDVIIIGGGAAGLMAAKKLVTSGLKICILEARDRLGGRISSFKNGLSEDYFEGGAEFIHGNLDVTLDLLQEAGLDKTELEGEVFNVTNGTWKQENDFLESAELIIEKLKEVKDDMSMSAFIQQYFSDKKFESLRNSLTSYVEGYYSGEIERTSAKSFLKEWMSEDDQQYRPTGGYGNLVDYLEDFCRKAGISIELSVVVKEVRWSQGQVEVIDDTNHSYIASKLIVTVPLGIWQAPESEKGVIKYTPLLIEKTEAAKQLGFGSVIKVLLYFNEAFWTSKELSESINEKTGEFHMLLSDSPITTWWSQFPVKSTLLTGWLSGPKAAKLKDVPDEEILQRSFESLENIFGLKDNFLKEKLAWSKVFNWTADPFTRGSYSYSTLQTPAARKIMLEPVQDTLFFAGEGLYEGPEMGTVEAALTSGLKTAERVLMA